MNWFVRLIKAITGQKADMTERERVEAAREVAQGALELVASFVDEHDLLVPRVEIATPRGFRLALTMERLENRDERQTALRVVHSEEDHTNGCTERCRFERGPHPSDSTIKKV